MPPALPRPPGCFRCLPMRPWPWLTWPRSFRVFLSLDGMLAAQRKKGGVCEISRATDNGGGAKRLTSGRSRPGLGRGLRSLAGFAGFAGSRDRQVGSPPFSARCPPSAPRPGDGGRPKTASASPSFAQARRLRPVAESPCPRNPPGLLAERPAAEPTRAPRSSSRSARPRR